MRRAGLALPLALVLLSGCGADPAEQVRQDVAALTDAANDRDADRLRDQADALLTTLDAQREAGELTEAEAEPLIALAQSVRTRADLIDTALLERRRLEAEAKAAAAAKALEEARAQLEAEQRQAEEAAREDDDEKGEGKGKDGEKDD